MRGTFGPGASVDFEKTAYTFARFAGSGSSWLSDLCLLERPIIVLMSAISSAILIWDPRWDLWDDFGAEKSGSTIETLLLTG